MSDDELTQADREQLQQEYQEYINEASAAELVAFALGYLTAHYTTEETRNVKVPKLERDLDEMFKSMPSAASN